MCRVSFFSTIHSLRYRSQEWAWCKVTCDSSKGSGWLADSSWVSGPYTEVISCATRHQELKVCHFCPIRRDIHQGLWVVVDSTSYHCKVLNIRTIDAVPRRHGPVTLAYCPHLDVYSSRRTWSWGGKSLAIKSFLSVELSHCTLDVMYLLITCKTRKHALKKTNCITSIYYI